MRRPNCLQRHCTCPLPARELCAVRSCAAASLRSQAMLSLQTSHCVHGLRTHLQTIRPPVQLVSVTRWPGADAMIAAQCARKALTTQLGRMPLLHMRTMQLCACATTVSHRLWTQKNARRQHKHAPGSLRSRFCCTCVPTEDLLSAVSPTTGSAARASSTASESPKLFTKRTHAMMATCKLHASLQGGGRIRRLASFDLTDCAC